MKKIKVFLVLVLLLAVAAVVVAFLLPAQYRVERSVLVQAKPKAVFAYLNSLKKWPLWTVWTVDRDPTMQATFSGAEEGVGAIYQWTGEKVGNGRLTVTRVEPDRGVWYDLDFEQGKYVSQGGITLEAVGEATRVTWYNAGNLGNNPLNRYFGLFMDRMMGPDFEQGLGHLRRIVAAK